MKAATSSSAKSPAPAPAPAAAPESAPEISLDQAIAAVTKHYKLASPVQAIAALSAARVVSLDKATQGQEDARLPVLSTESRHTTSAKDRTGKERGVITRDVSSLSQEAIKERRLRERRLNAAVILGLARA